VAAVVLLCAAGARPDTVFQHDAGAPGSTALWAAASAGHVDVIDALVRGVLWEPMYPLALSLSLTTLDVSHPADARHGALGAAQHGM
jgi:hypothetical protein